MSPIELFRSLSNGDKAITLLAGFALGLFFLAFVALVIGVLSLPSYG